MTSSSELDPCKLSVAPTDFDICNSFDNVNGNGVISVAVENCQLCGSSRNPFHCVNCVNEGEFSFKNNGCRFIDKKYALQRLKKQKAELLSRFQGVLNRGRVLDDKLTARDLARQRVHLLTEAVNEASTKLKSEKEKLEATRKQNESIHVRLERLSGRQRRLTEHIGKLFGTIDNQKGELAISEDQLCSLRQQHIRQLVQHIFPITQIQARTDTDSGGYVSELAEARHTAYIKGRWVYTDNGGEHKYCIVHPTLPGNGDYSAYVHWLSESKTATPGTAPIVGEEQPAYSIVAALTYTSQLVTLISHFLDINLPQKNWYSDFCRYHMTERRFSKLVFRLNHNVLQLCFSQNVPMEVLHPRHTIHNLLMLLNTPHQGRCQPFAVNCDMILSLEASVTRGDTTTEEENSEDETDGPWDDPQPINEQEWESVPYFPSEMEMRSYSQQTDCDYYTSAVVPSGGHRDTGTPATTSVMGNLVSSAAASVTSLWRAAAWKS